MFFPLDSRRNSRNSRTSPRDLCHSSKYANNKLHGRHGGKLTGVSDFKITRSRSVVAQVLGTA